MTTQNEMPEWLKHVDAWIADNEVNGVPGCLDDAAPEWFVWMRAHIRELREALQGFVDAPMYGAARAIDPEKCRYVAAERLLSRQEPPEVT